MKIVFASDHAGFELKEKLRKHLTKQHDVSDFGTFDETSVDYPAF